MAGRSLGRDTGLRSSGLSIQMQNRPALWRVFLDGQEIGHTVVEVAIFASVDSPLEVHLLRIDPSLPVVPGRIADDHPREFRLFQPIDWLYQESYVGQDVLVEGPDQT